MPDEFITHKFTTQEIHPFAIALTTYHGNLCIAWADSNDCLNLVHSYDGGQSFDPSSVFTIKEPTNSKPALAVYRDQLYIAWTTTVGYICLMRSTDGGRTFDPSTKSVSDQRPQSTFTILGSFATALVTGQEDYYDGPSLAVYQDRLYVAWADADHHPCLMFSTDGGESFDPSTKSVSHEVCFHSAFHPAPTLAIYHDHLSMLWIDQGEHINIMHSTDGGRSFDSKTNFKLKEKSYQSPAFINYHGRPLVAWTGVAFDNMLNILYAPGGELKAGVPLIKLTSKEKAVWSPALALCGDRLVIGWTDWKLSSAWTLAGAKTGHLNLAQCQILQG